MTTAGRPSPTPATEARFLTAAEVAEKLRTTPVNIVRLCRAGTIPATKPFGTWLISEAWLEDHLAASSNDQQEQAS